MAVRGVYSDAEKKILENFEKDADTRVGWCKPEIAATGPSMTTTPTVTARQLQEHVVDIDPYNPLWCIEPYAAATRWGGLIAHPLYADRFKPPERMPDPPKGQLRSFYLIGHEIENFQPIRPGDTIRAWQYRPVLEDSTDRSGEGPRKFRYIDVACDFLNQRNEIVTTFKQLVEFTYYDGPLPAEKYLPDYGYTKEQLDYLAGVTESEKPRGSGILYWEDVQVGDETPTITTGPTEYYNMVIIPPPRPGELAKRSFFPYEEPVGGPVMLGYVPDPETGLIYPTQGGRHNYDRPAQFEGGRRAWLYNFQVRYPMCRLVTNWMGDDGFLCKFGWRHIWRTPVGDALLITGEVAKKYVENGEHLVDLKVWCLNLRGCITDMGQATVKLVSKEDAYPGGKKVTNR